MSRISKKTLILSSIAVFVLRLDYSTISKNAKFIAFTNSPGDSYEVYATLGMSTTFVVYNTAEDAREAGKTLTGVTPIFVRANLLMLLPDGAKSDVDYAISQYTNSTSVIEESDLSLDNKAIWQINFADFSTMYTNGEKSEDIKVFETTTLMLGITSEAGWIGTSSDGLNWDGKLVNSDTNTIPDPTNIISYLSSQLGFLLKDGTLGSGDEVTEENQTGVIYQRQSMLTNYMLISNNKEVAGGLTDYATGAIDKGEVLPESEGILRVETSPNAFFGLMMAKTSIYAVTDFSNVVFTVEDADGTSSIRLTPIE